jgi:hypothetical protein
MNSLGFNLPAAMVCLISIVVGLLMVLVFARVSDQNAIRLAKDRLKAHLLALRLFQDQIPVVLRSYLSILLATGHYLRLAFKPLLILIIPLTLLIVELDRYLGLAPVQPGQSFLVKARVSDPELLDRVNLDLPDELRLVAPAVHVPSEGAVVWKLVAKEIGYYQIRILVSDQQRWTKSVVVGSSISRLSPVRLRGEFWKRLFLSAEPALPARSSVQSIEMLYPRRDIEFVGYAWNWIWLFFIISLVAGFLFKSILKIEI